MLDSMTTFLTAVRYLPAGGVGVPTHELHLHDALLRAGSLLLPDASFERVAISEFTLSGARPDVVFADVDLAQLLARRDAGSVPSTATAEIAIRAALRRARGQQSRERIVESASRYVTATKARRALARAERLEIVVAGQRGMVIDPRQRPAVRSAVAIEAKIGKWVVAARQAQRWRLAFDRAWLAFPQRYLSCVPRDLPGVRLFGLAGVDEQGDVQLVAAPPLRRADDFNQTLVEEYLYARWCDEQDARNEGACAGEVPFVLSLAS